jgi:branched-chain amino acid transport system permease protein
VTRTRLVLFGVYALVFLALPAVADNYTLRLATFVCMYTALALSWNIIGGYTGYPSFSTAAFVGLGSYAGALLQKAGVPMVGAWVGATVVVALFAFCLGFAILRMRGHYFAIGSISIVEVLRLVTSSWAGFTGGGDGLNVPILEGGPEYAGRVFLYAMLAAMILAFVTVVLVDRGRLGFGLRCIKQNEDAAAMVGIDTNRYKIFALTLSGVWCGTVGAIYASWVGYIAPTDSFSILLTLKVPVMALLGGEGTVWGPVIGALAFVLMEETIWAQFLDWNQAILGAVIVLLIFFLPGGLLRLDWSRLRRSRTAASAMSSPATADAKGRT